MSLRTLWRPLLILVSALVIIPTLGFSQSIYYIRINTNNQRGVAKKISSLGISLSKLAKPFSSGDLTSQFYRIDGPLSPTLLTQLKGLDGVQYVEPARDAMPLFQPDDPAAQVGTGGQAAILDKIKAYDAWDRTQGDTSVMIGILDSGVDILHPDLAANAAHNYADPINGVDDDHNGYIDDYNGYDLSNNDNNPRPDGNQTHGTQVASISSASFNNGLGMAGLAGRCKYLAVKVYGTRFTGYEGILYATDRGCKVINLSWGNNGYPTQFEQDVIDYATGHNVIVVAAAGNTPGILRFYPASYRGVVSVGFTELTDARAAASTLSPEITVMAPGIDVFGITTTGTFGNIGGGSSYAAPMVSALAALAISAAPSLRPAEIINLIRYGADPIDQLPANQSMAGYLGAGRINMGRTLQTIRDAYPYISSISLDPQQRHLPAGSSDLTVECTNTLLDAAEITIGLQIVDPAQALNVRILGPDSLTFTNVPRDSRITILPAQGWALRLDTEERNPIRIRAKIRTESRTYYQTIALEPGYLWQNLIGPAGQLTLCNNARIGYWDGVNSYGSGLTYKGRQVLGEGGIILGLDSNSILNNVTGQTGKDDDFTGVSFQTVRTDSVYQIESLVNSVPTAGGRLKVAMATKGYAWPDKPGNPGMITEFTILNTDTIRRDTLRVGILADWDINKYWLNQTRWDSTANFGYSYAYGDSAFTALVPLTPDLDQGLFAIDAVPLTTAGNIDITDGFSKVEKWRTLVRERRSAGGLAGTNNVLVYHTTLPLFRPEVRYRVAYAWVAAKDLTSLRYAARASRLAYRQMRQGNKWLNTTQFSNCLGNSITIPITSGRWRVTDTLNRVVYEGGGPFTITPTLPLYRLQVVELDSMFVGPSTTLEIRSAVSRDSAIVMQDTVTAGRPFPLTTISGSDTCLSVDIWFNGALLATIPYDSVYTAANPGDYRFCYSLVSTNGCRRESCSNLVVAQAPVSVRMSAWKEARPMPNPASGLLTVPATAAPQRIWDAQGKEIWSSTGKASNINVSTWPRGIYLWQSGSQQMRLVLQ